MLIPNTPEAYLPRSDSKKDATTCKGITAKGRPCRRSLATPLRNKPSISHGTAVSPIASTNRESIEVIVNAFFCWQHKDQAEQVLATSGKKLTTLQNRNSIDTLVSRLGIINNQDLTQPEINTSKNQRENDKAKHSARHNGQGLTFNLPEEVLPSPPMLRRRTLKQQGYFKKQKKPSFLALLCCIGSAADDDYVEAIRHKKGTSKHHRQEMSMGTASAIPAKDPRCNSTQSKPYNNVAQGPYMSSPQPLSPTSQLMSFIPQNLPPRTTSLLLNELIKPISNHDDNGYIYMFWLTDSNLAPPSDALTSSLLPASPSQPRVGRKESETFQQPNSNAPGSKNTILLKIGRASNVHRRLGEWTRQCGYSLSLIRFYPYVPSACLTLPNPSLNANAPPQFPPNNVSKTPHVHRVERLIHIELGEKRVKQAKCGMCGKEHREWFEVEANREGLRSVDEVIRRWVGWAEGLESQDSSRTNIF